jgi:serine/threonine protein phosphatase PrpC
VALRIVEEFSLSDVGRQRHTNEDSYLESSPIFAVADGMGGARAGEVASRMAVEAFAEERDVDASAETQLAEIARSANRKIYALAQEDSSRAGMGTTFTAVMVVDNELAIGHVGDSRAYRLRDGALERLTHDHSLVEELVRQGKLTSEEAETHPQRSIITRALGPEPEVDVETFTYPARGGDVYLLCSDGLTGMVAEDRVAEIIREGRTLEAAARKLIEEANENGGRDNITVVLFRLGDTEEDGEDTETLSGAETKVGGVDVESVREAVREADDAEAAQATRPRQVPEEPTMVLTKERARTRQVPRDDVTGFRRTVPEPAGKRRRLRRYVTALLVLVVLGAVVAGLYMGSREFYFVGTNDRGVVTLYRGLPYDLPLGIELYEEEYVTSVPAQAIQPARRRRRDVDQQLRSHGDALDLVRDIERKY